MSARRPATPIRLEVVTDSPPVGQRAHLAPAPAARSSNDITPRSDDRLLLPVDEAARRLSIGRSLLYELLAAGEIRSVHVGRLRRVPASALTDFIDQRCQQPTWNPEEPR